jgi:hypothetical protein
MQYLAIILATIGALPLSIGLIPMRADEDQLEIGAKLLMLFTGIGIEAVAAICGLIHWL